MKYLFSFLFALFVLSCTSQPKSNYSKIEFNSGACFGFCPIFSMTIDSERNAVFEAQQFNFSRNVSKKAEGTFKTTIKPEDYAALVALLDSAKLKSLNDFYGNKNITDLPTGRLNVTFSDGSTKQIEDYGKNGNDDLKKIYAYFEGLKKSQNWTKVE